MKITTIQNTYIEAEIVLADRRLKTGETVQLRCVLDSKLGPVYLTENLTVDADKSTLNDTYCRWEYDLEDKYILPGTYSFEIVIVQSSGKVIPISHKAENSLVIVPAERGDVYLAPLAQKVNHMFKKGLPFEYGGTDAKTVAEARQNLNFLGKNPVTIDTDTPSTWIALGTGIAYISASGYIIEQPYNYGFIENVVSDTGLVKQIWHTQTASGSIYKRAGTKNGWYSESWTKVFDSESFIPVKNGGIGTNTSVDIGETEHLKCVNRFVTEMNRVAAQLGMSNSTFKTPSGDCSKPINKTKTSADINYNSYTTASDMMRLLAAARHSPSVLAIMGTLSYKFKKNDKSLTQSHVIVSNSTWDDWADENGYVILAAKGGSLSGSVAQNGTGGILNYVLLIKAMINNQERIFGVAIVGLENGEGEAARNIIQGLIGKFSGAADNAAITEAANRKDYSVGMMAVDFTSSESFEEDIERINDTTSKYCFSHNKDAVRVAASLAKILNAIVAVSHFDNHYCSINNDDIVGGSSISVSKGDVLTTYDALNVMMLASCNVCATMIARDIGKRLPERGGDF